METDLMLEMEPEETAVVEDKQSLLQKVLNPLEKCWNKFNEIVPKKVFIGVVLGVAVVAAAICCYGYATNNYKTPIRRVEKFANQASYDVEKAGLEALNKIGTRQWKKIIKIMHNSDLYLDTLEQAEELIKSNFEFNQDLYGENYSVSFTEIEKTELTKYELRDYRYRLQRSLSNIEDLVDSAEEFKSEDWRECADELGLSKADTKQLIAEYAKLLADLGRIQVTEGYEVTLERKITGELMMYSESGEPRGFPISAEMMEDYDKWAAIKETAQNITEQLEGDSDNRGITYVVLKVNGRWIEYSSFKAAYDPFGWI